MKSWIAAIIGCLAIGGLALPVTALGARPAWQTAPAVAVAGSGPVNINQADAEALQALSGVGPAKAAAIIAWRSQHGPFRSPDDLEQVRGIGPALVTKNRARIRLE